MNTNPTVSRLVERAKITEQPNTRAKANEEGDSYKFSRISLGHYACTHGKNTYIIIDKEGKIGCSCDDMTYRCTDTSVCKHGTKFIDLEVPPQIPVSGELIKKLILMGWVGGKDDLHPPELLKPIQNTSVKPEPYEESDPVLDQAIPEMPEPPNGDCSNCTTETVHYECPKCGENVDINGDEMADWILKHLDTCPGKKSTPPTQAQEQKVEAVAPLAPGAFRDDNRHPPEDAPPDPTIQPVPTNLATALCNMQKVDLLAVTDSNNPFHNAKYADLASVWAAIRKPLTDNGLAVIQTTEQYPQGITVVTTLVHISGETFTSRLSCEVPKSKPDKNGQIKPNVQGLGSTITYLRRYSLAAMVGVAPIDDDGEAAMSR